MVFEQCGNRSLRPADQCHRDVELELEPLSWSHRRCVELRLLVEDRWIVETVIFEVEAVSTGFDIVLFLPTNHLMSLK